MKKFTLIALLIILSSSFAFAQKGSAWENQVGFELGYQSPSGRVADILNLSGGYGLAGTYYRQLESKNLFLSASIAFISQGTEISYYGSNAKKDNFSVTYLSAGMRYNFDLTDIQPYVGAELSYNIFSLPDDISTEYDNSLGIIFKAGARYPLSPSMDLDANLKLHKMLSDTKWGNFGINVGIFFALGN